MTMLSLVGRRRFKNNKQFLSTLIVLTLFLSAVPFVSAQASGTIFFNNFDGDNNVLQNQSVGTITGYVDGGNVSQTNSTLLVQDPTAGEQGFRINFTEIQTDAVWFAFTMAAAQSSGFGGIAASNCTKQMGLGILGTCPTAGQEAWDNNLVTFGNSNFVRVYSSLNACGFVNLQFYDYRLLHNFTDNTATLFQDGALCGTKVVDGGQEMSIIRGIAMQSGGGATGNYSYRDICAYPHTVGDETFDCALAPDEPTFTDLSNNATSLTGVGSGVQFSVNISQDPDTMDTCWFTHNDSGSFVNLTVRTCSSGIIFQANITVTSAVGAQVCGFYGANDTTGLQGQSSNSCFVVAETNIPSSNGTANNASSLIINRVVKFSTTLNDDFQIGNWTFGKNDTGTFVNLSTVTGNFGSSVFVSVNETVLTTPNLFVCGTFYFRDVFGNTNDTTTCFTTSDLLPANITAFNILTNVTILNFSVIVEGITDPGFFASGSTTAGRVEFSLPVGNYSIVTNATGFSNGTGTLFANATAAAAINISMFSDPSSISLTILNASDETLLTQRVDITVFGITVDTPFNTTSGTIFMSGLESGPLTVLVESVGWSSRTYFVTLAPADHTDLTARLANLTEGNIQEVTFTIKDSADRFLPDATIVVARRVNATFLPVDNKVTDVSGQALFNLDKTEQYQFTISASGFIARQFNLVPLNTEYAITLTPTAQINFTSLFDVVQFSTLPQGSIVQSEPTSFNFSTVSALGAIQFFGFNVSNPNVNQFVNTSGSPSGGTQLLTLNLTGQTGTTVTASYFIKVTGFPLFEFTRIFRVETDVAPSNQSLLGTANQFGGEFSPSMKALTAVITSAVIAVAVASFLGGVEAGLAAFGIQILFMLIGWISFIHMGLMALVMGGVWLFLGRRGQ